MAEEGTLKKFNDTESSIPFPKTEGEYQDQKVKNKSRSRSSSEKSAKSSVGYGSGGKQGSHVWSKHSDGTESEIKYGGAIIQTTPISAALNNLKDDILYCQQSDVVSKKRQLKTISELVTGGEQVYMEGRRGNFMPTTRSEALRSTSRTVWLEEVSELELQTPLDHAIIVQKIFGPLSTICFGLLGGVALMQFFLSYGYVRNRHNMEEIFLFIESYNTFARVAPTAFYLLLAVCIISIFDRYDLAHLDIRHCCDTLLYRHGCFLVILYVITMIITLCAAELDDMLLLYPHDKSFTKDQEDMFHYLSQWHTLNMLRCVFAVIGWIVTAIAQPDDLLLHHLKSIKQFDVNPKDILVINSPSTYNY